jgi:hypothetical protein
MAGNGLDFELDVDSRMAGAADAVTQLDRFEAQFKASKAELDSLEKSFLDTDKSLEKLSSQLADTRIAMQRAMQEGDDKKFWKLAQTTDQLTQKEEALRKKSGELKTAISAQQKATQAAADKVGEATAAEKRHEAAGAASEKRMGAISGLVDRYGGKLGELAKSTTTAADTASDLTAGMGALDIVAVGTVAAVTAVALAVVALGAAFVAAAIAVGKYAVEQANAKRNTEQTLRALTQNNEAAKAVAGSFEGISHDTGVGSDQLLSYSRGLTETRRQMGLLQPATKDLQKVLKAAATASQALDDQAAGQQIIDQFNAGLFTADQLADRVDKKYGDVVKEKMLGLSQQMTTLEGNLSAITSSFDVKPILEGLQRIVDLTDANSASGKFLKDIFDQVFGPSTSKLVDKFFIGLERTFLQVEILVVDAEIYWFKFKNAITKALDIDLGPFGNLKDRVKDVGTALEDATGVVFDFLNPITEIHEEFSQLSQLWDVDVKAIHDLEDAFDAKKMEKVASDFIDGFVNGLSQGATRVKNKVKEVGTSAVDAMKDVLGIHSPSTVFADVGLQIPAGLEQGVDMGAPSVAQSINALVKTPELAQAAASAQGSSSGSGSGGSAPVFNITINGVAGVEDAIDKLEEALVAIFERRALQIGTDAETAEAT